MSTFSILTYHSQNIGGHSARENDHVALAEDLETLHRLGARIMPLAELVNAALGGDDTGPAPCVALSLDDGCDFDVRDLDYPGHGVQRSMLGIMEDFVARHGTDAQPGLHATSFVIASPEARRLIDARSLFGRGWISDDWWRDANAHPMLDIGNHGWDHAHPDLVPEGSPVEDSSWGFHRVDDLEGCERQVERAALLIERLAGRRPELFAYPFGESSDYIREEYFPRFGARHGCVAAFGTEPGPLTPASKRWNLPRWVCGRDWQDGSGLERIVRGG